MKLVLNNITYHDCPVDIRERVTFEPEQLQTADLINRMSLSKGKCD